MDRGGSDEFPRSRDLAPAMLLVAIALVRLVYPGQPIVENYAGRQVPTAMVARNLERGSGFLRPRLDTEPSPNYFLVEPPVYQALVVGLRRLTGAPLEACGRGVSALATALGALGLFGLVARRDRRRAAFVATAAFGAFPLTIRYGRAFQPDALMLGMVLLGVDGWDRAARGGAGAWAWRVVGWLGLAVGFAAKVTAALVLVPLEIVVLRGQGWRTRFAAASAMIPVLIWYAWANRLMAGGEGSGASAANRSIWLAVLGLSALGSMETLRHIGRFLLVRAFTPLGVALGAWGLCCPRSYPREPDLWRTWAAAALLVLALLAAKLHHEYYWLILTPVVAAGLGRAWSRLEAWWPAGAWAFAAVFLGLCGWLSRSTFRTPEEWRDLRIAAAEVRRVVPAGSLMVAPEPLLYEADYRGCRLEFTASSARRAAGEWRGAGVDEVESPLDLIGFYAARGAGFVADVGAGPDDARRLALHAAIRGRYKVLVDRPSVIIAELQPPGSPGMSSEERRVTIPDFATWKKQGRRIAVLTAYDHPGARLADAAGVDCLLVGDSMGTTVQGRETTLAVTLDQIVYHAEMVARAARRALVVADLPFLTYHASRRQAILSSGRLLKETDCQAVKLEGGRRMAATIRAVVDSEIPVMAHVGLTPQSIRRLGAYKVQRAEDALLDDARAVADAGAFAVVLECVPAGLARRISAEIPIPTIGIGAGPGCDGQVLVYHDLLGLGEFRPRFARRYAELGEAIKSAVGQYVRDVRDGSFPSESESFH